MTERRRYNEVVQAYNTSIKNSDALRGLPRFQPAKYFEAPESAKALPKVQF